MANTVQDLQLQEYVLNRKGQSSAKLVPDLHASGYEKFRSSSLATFNKKIRDMASGRSAPPETDDIPSPAFVNMEDEDLDD
jgi:hypothetical protein